MSDNITIKIDKDGEPIAFIHNAPANNNYVLSYQHIGQHGEAHKEYMRQDCVYPRTPQHIIKAFALLKELKSIGYEIDGLNDDIILPWGQDSW